MLHPGPTINCKFELLTFLIEYLQMAVLFLADLNFFCILSAQIFPCSKFKKKMPAPLIFCIFEVKKDDCTKKSSKLTLWINSRCWGSSVYFWVQQKSWILNCINRLWAVGLTKPLRFCILIGAFSAFVDSLSFNCSSSMLEPSFLQQFLHAVVYVIS